MLPSFPPGQCDTVKGDRQTPIRVRKFSDPEFLALYNRGLSDKEIARRFGAGNHTVWARRVRLGLEPNYGGPRRTEGAGRDLKLGIEELMGLTPKRFEEFLRLASKRELEQALRGTYRMNHR